MKILTVCRAGQCRSVSAKIALANRGHDVLAIGWEKNTKETMEMLCDWADRIIVMKKEFCDKIPAKSADKMICFDVGRDVWSNPFHPELRHKIDNILRYHNEF